MIRHFITAGLLLCLCASLAVAKQGQVRTKDGRTLEGDITDMGVDGVTIKTKVGTITLHQADVASIQYAASIKDLYQQRLAALPKDAGAKAHTDLARWLYESKEYQLAQKELDAALALEPANTEALLLKQTVDRSMLWEMTRVNTDTTKTPATGTQTPAANPRDRRLLNADQINIIRQQELKDTDRVRVRLERDVARQYAESQGINVADFARVPDLAKAMMILNKGTREMRPDVKIVSDPQALADFKSRIQPVILQGCATANCHGGVNSGTFRLYSPADNEATTYTNFYILTQYETKTGERRAINRARPKDSLILEYGLPRDISEADHPEVVGYTSVFRNAADPRYAQILLWLRNALNPLEPQYGIDYVLPGQAAAPAQTQPAPLPPAQPAAPAQPQPQPQPKANQQPADGGGDGGAADVLKQARERIRPMGIR